MEKSSWVASGPHSGFAFALRTEKEGVGGILCTHSSVFYIWFFCFVLSKVAKLPQVVQQQTPVASIQQVGSADTQPPGSPTRTFQ